MEVEMRRRVVGLTCFVIIGVFGLCVGCQPIFQGGEIDHVYGADIRQWYVDEDYTNSLAFESGSEELWYKISTEDYEKEEVEKMFVHSAYQYDPLSWEEHGCVYIVLVGQGKHMDWEMWSPSLWTCWKILRKSNL